MRRKHVTYLFFYFLNQYKYLRHSLLNENISKTTHFMLLLIFSPKHDKDTRITHLFTTLNTTNA